jgi:hypothetical protein
MDVEFSCSQQIFQRKFTIFIKEFKMDAHMIILHAGVLCVILPNAFVTTERPIEFLVALLYI